MKLSVFLFAVLLSQSLWAWNQLNCHSQSLSSSFQIRKFSLPNRVGADAVLSNVIGEVNFGGFWLVEVEQAKGLLSKTVYQTDNKSELSISQRLKACGRGSCDDGEAWVTRAQFKSVDGAVIYYACD